MVLHFKYSHAHRIKAGVGYKQSLSSHGSRERNSGLAFQSIGKNWQRVASGFIIGSSSHKQSDGLLFKRSLGLGVSVLVSTAKKKKQKER